MNLEKLQKLFLGLILSLYSLNLISADISNVNPDQNTENISWYKKTYNKALPKVKSVGTSLKKHKEKALALGAIATALTALLIYKSRTKPVSSKYEPIKHPKPEEPTELTEPMGEAPIAPEPNYPPQLPPAPAPPYEAPGAPENVPGYEAPSIPSEEEFIFPQEKLYKTPKYRTQEQIEAGKRKYLLKKEEIAAIKRKEAIEKEKAELTREEAERQLREQAQKEEAEQIRKSQEEITQISSFENPPPLPITQAIQTQPMLPVTKPLITTQSINRPENLFAQIKAGSFNLRPTQQTKYISATSPQGLMGGAMQKPLENPEIRQAAEEYEPPTNPEITTSAWNKPTLSQLQREAYTSKPALQQSTEQMLPGQAQFVVVEEEPKEIETRKTKPLTLEEIRRLISQSSIMESSSGF